MRPAFVLGALIVFAGCTSTFDVRVEGRVTAARPDAASPAPGIHESSSEVSTADLEPLPEAFVSIAPRFGSTHAKEPRYMGPVDPEGSFRYASSGEADDPLRGVSIHVSAPGFMPVDRFIPVDREGRFDRRDLLVVLEDSRAAMSRMGGKASQ